MTESTETAPSDTSAGASAYEAAVAGGVIDTFLAMPDTREKQRAKYDRIRKLAGDEETQGMAMPAQYMFKDVP